jgi:hypothetical protein
VYSEPGHPAEVLLDAEDARGIIYDNKLFLAIPGQPSRVYTDKSDLSKFSYLSEKVVSILITGDSPGPGAGEHTVNFASTTFGQTPQYVMFDRDGDPDAVTGEVRQVVSFTATSITYQGVAPPAGSLYVRVYQGLDANDLLDFDGFVVFRERLCAWKGNRFQVAGFQGAGDIGIDFQEPVPLDWTVWDALNFRTVGDKSRDGEIQKIESLEDRLVAGTKGDEIAAIYDIRGYPPINARFENQMVVEKRSGRTGFACYDAVAVDRDGQTLFFAFGDGFWAYRGINATRIDDQIEGHPLFPKAAKFVAIVQDLVVFAEDEYKPDRTVRDASGRKSGIMQQVPAIWILDLKTNAWRSTQRIGRNTDGDVVLFDSPGRTGGVGVIFEDNTRKLAVGSGESLYTLNDEDVTQPPMENGHLQRMQTHRHSFGDMYPKRPSEITVHARQRFGLKLPVVFPGEGNNVGFSKDYVSQAKIRDVVGDVSIYSTFANGGRGTPRLAGAFGYFGEALLYGQDRPFPQYDEITLELPSTGNPTPQRYLQKVNLSGTVDRIDVFAADVINLTTRIYDSDGGTLGSLRYQSPITHPKYGLSPSPDFYWFPTQYEGIQLDGEYFIEIVGDCRIRTYSGQYQLEDELGALVQAGTNFAARAIQIVGGTYVSDEVINMWETYTPLGKVAWGGRS